MGGKMEKDLGYFIEQVVSLPLFWEANYYLRCMKKAPHGGVERVHECNYNIKYRYANTDNLFRGYNGEIPSFLKKLIVEEREIWDECIVDIEQLLRLCLDGDFWYAGFRVLKLKQGKEIDATVLWHVLGENLKFADYYDLDNIEQVLYMFTCYLIKEKMIDIQGIDEIKKHERLCENHNKYGLSYVNNAEFGRQGLIINEKYYLYNIFLDISIGKFMAKMPITLEIVNLIPNINIYMRCDEVLAVNKGEALFTATVDFQVYRGIKVALSDLENIIGKKEIVIHYNPTTLDKLLLIVKKDTESNGELCYHIEIEELWNPEYIRDGIVTLNYIHAKYVPAKKGFIHIDYSVNQYITSVYKLKYYDMVNESNVPVDKYADVHYKIWCVEGEFIEIKYWSSLVSATLSEPFRKLFFEMFPEEISSEELLMQ